MINALRFQLARVRAGELDLYAWSIVAAVLLALLVTSGCASTPVKLQELADRIDFAAAKASANIEQVREAATGELRQLAGRIEQVEAAAESPSGDQLLTSGGITAAGMVLLHLLRNRTRRRELEHHELVRRIEDATHGAPT